LEDGPSQSLFDRLKSLFRRLGNDNAAERFEEEMQDLIEQGAEKGVITPGEGAMIQSIFEFGETVVREVMVPRTSIVAADQSDSLKLILDLVLEKGHSRLPIYDGDIDHIVGMLHVKDLLRYWGTSLKETLPPEIIRPPILVPEDKKIMELLTELRLKKSHMAMILDEYGGTAGLVTLEDIIEEIIGEIHDEYDDEEEWITQVDGDTLLVDARLYIGDLEDYLSVKFPEGDFETVGGFIIDLTGRVPEQNEEIRHRNLVFTIRSADERKINLIEIKRSSADSETQTGLA